MLPLVNWNQYSRNRLGLFIAVMMNSCAEVVIHQFLTMV